MKKLPIGKLKRRCDTMWSVIVRVVGKCEICGTTEKRLNAHHLISRRVLLYRWEPSNGICICVSHHKWDVNLSAHVAPWGLEEWLATNKPEQYKWWVDHRKQKFSEIELTYDDLEDTYARLELEYKNKIKKSPYRIYDFLYNEEGQKQICSEYESNLALSMRDLGKKYEVSGHTIAFILKSHGIVIRDRVEVAKHKLKGVKRSPEVGEKIRETKKNKDKFEINKKISQSMKLKQEEKIILESVERLYDHYRKNHNRAKGFSPEKYQNPAPRSRFRTRPAPPPARLFHGTCGRCG